VRLPNADQVLDAVSRGESLPQDKKLDIVHQLESRKPKEDPYTLIHILGKANQIDCREIIEQYLRFGDHFGKEYEHPDMVRKIAVQVLCDWWVLPEYFNTASQLAFNDPSIDVRMAAAVSVGNLGKYHPELRREAAKLLLRGFASSREEQELWESFYEGMLQLLEIPYEQRPDPTKDLRPEDVDDSVLEKVKRIPGDSAGDSGIQIP